MKKEADRLEITLVSRLFFFCKKIFLKATICRTLIFPLVVFIFYDKGFYADDRCKGCRICEKICPTCNITMEDNRPKWNHHCHGCNACVAYCPTKAVQFKVPQVYKELDSIICKMLCLPEKRKRYHHPRIKAKDLMNDRKEIKL